MIRRTLELAGRALAALLPCLSYILTTAEMASRWCEGKPAARGRVRADFSELGRDAGHLLWLHSAVTRAQGTKAAGRVYDMRPGS
jgi:hypothetical protein